MAAIGGAGLVHAQVPLASMPAGDTLSQAASNPLKQDNNKPGASPNLACRVAGDEHGPIAEPRPAFVTQACGRRAHSPREHEKRTNTLCETRDAYGH